MRWRPCFRGRQHCAAAAATSRWAWAVVARASKRQLDWPYVPPPNQAPPADDLSLLRYRRAHCAFAPPANAGQSIGPALIVATSHPGNVGGEKSEHTARWLGLYGRMCAHPGGRPPPRPRARNPPSRESAQALPRRTRPTRGVCGTVSGYARHGVKATAPGSRVRGAHPKGT
jgi:hypothetical protein